VALELKLHSLSSSQPFQQDWKEEMSWVEEKLVLERQLLSPFRLFRNWLQQGHSLESQTSLAL
jgi:hypothetical protein